MTPWKYRKKRDTERFRGIVTDLAGKSKVELAELSRMVTTTLSFMDSLFLYVVCGMTSMEGNRDLWRRGGGGGTAGIDIILPLCLEGKT